MTWDRNTIDRAIHSLCNSMSAQDPKGQAIVTVFPDGQTPRDSKTVEYKHLPGLLVPLCIRLKQRMREPTIYIDGGVNDTPAAAIYWHPRSANDATPVVTVTPIHQDDEAARSYEREILERTHDLIAWREPVPAHQAGALRPALAR